jgi:hypothetical protein
LRNFEFKYDLFRKYSDFSDSIEQMLNLVSSEGTRLQTQLEED